MRNLFTTLFLFIGSLSLHAQLENIWIFGTKAALDFNSGNPVPFSTTMPINLEEGCANVCDNSGQLLFVTDGYMVLDRNYNIMPNGNGIITDIPPILPGLMASTSQSALIVPMTGSPHKYYLFSLTPAELGPNAGRLYYSVINMDSNGGLGDVEPGQKGILIDSLLTEHLSCVTGDNCNVWVVVASLVTPKFEAFEINGLGVNTTPVISTFVGPPPMSVQFGRMAFAPNRKKMAIGKINTQELYDFDPSTGLLSNQIILDSLNGSYGMCFSPDNSKLYTNANHTTMTQYDLSSGVAATIIASKNILGSYFITDLKLGPDNKIYSREYGNTIGRINAPNLYGAACAFTPAAIVLTSPSITGLGFPNVVPVLQQDSTYTTTDTSMCSKEERLQLQSPMEEATYLWEDGSTAALRSISNAGTYWVQSKVLCHYRVDTFIVKKTVIELDLGDDITICSGEPINIPLAVSVPEGSFVAWSTGSTNSAVLITDTGTVWVTVTNPPCSNQDSIHIGMYMELCGCAPQMPTAFSPNGDGINDTYQPVIANDCSIKQYSLNIYNRYGQRVYRSLSEKQGWDGTINGHPADIGTYMYNLRFIGGAKQIEYHREGDLILVR